MRTAVGIIDSRIPPPDGGCEELVCMTRDVMDRRRALAVAACPELVAEAQATVGRLAVCLDPAWWEGACPAVVRVAYAEVRSWDRICPAMSWWACRLEDAAEFYLGLCLDREWDRAMVSADLPWRCPSVVVPVELTEVRELVAA